MTKQRILRTLGSAVILLLLVTRLCLAADEKVPPYFGVTIATQLPQPYGRTIFTLKRSSAGKFFSVIMVKTERREILVPPIVLAEFPNPVLNSVQITEGKDEQGQTEISIKFLFGEPSRKGTNLYSKAVIVIQEEAVQSIHILRPDGTWQLKELKGSKPNE